MATIKETPAYQHDLTKTALYYAEQDFLQGTNIVDHLGKTVVLAKDYLRKNPQMFTLYSGVRHKSYLRRITLSFKYKDKNYYPLKRFKNLYILYEYDITQDLVTLLRLRSYKQVF